MFEIRGIIILVSFFAIVWVWMKKYAELDIQAKIAGSYKLIGYIFWINASSKNSYGIYIIHVIMIGVFGTLLLNLDLIAVVKYLILIVSTYVGSNLVVLGFRSLVKALKSGQEKFISGAVDVG